MTKEELLKIYNEAKDNAFEWAWDGDLRVIAIMFGSDEPEGTFFIYRNNPAVIINEDWALIPNS